MLWQPVTVQHHLITTKLALWSTLYHAHVWPLSSNGSITQKQPMRPFRFG